MKLIHRTILKEPGSVRQTRTVMSLGSGRPGYDMLISFFNSLSVAALLTSTLKPSCCILVGFFNKTLTTPWCPPSLSFAPTSISTKINILLTKWCLRSDISAMEFSQITTVCRNGDFRFQVCNVNSPNKLQCKASKCSPNIEIKCFKLLGQGSDSQMIPSKTRFRPTSGCPCEIRRVHARIKYLIGYKESGSGHQRTTLTEIKATA